VIDVWTNMTFYSMVIIDIDIDQELTYKKGTGDVRCLATATGKLTCATLSANEKGKCHTALAE
jgi:hypothetical protein